MQRVFWGILVFFFVLFSLLPTFYELGRQGDLHADRSFELVHNYYTDYNLYLSRIREGREGAWTVTEKYTSEPHAGSYVQILYLYMGKVGALVGVPIERPDAIYHIGRIVLSITLLFLIAYAAKWAFEKSKPGWKFLGFLLAVTATSWPILVFHNNEWRLGGYMAWWSIMDSLQRITFLSHMLVGQSLILFILTTMTQSPVMQKAGNWVMLGLLACIGGIVFPAGLAFIFAVWGVFVIIDLLYKIPMRRPLRLPWVIERIIGPAAVAIISAPAIVYFFLIVRVYPWKRLVDFAVLHPLPFNLKEYLVAVGPILLFGIIGGIWALLKRERRLFIFIAWVITWFVCIIVFQHIKQESPLRFTEMIPQVPLAILTCYLFYSLYQGLSKPFRYLFIIIPIALVILGLMQMYSSWRWQKEFIDQKIIAGQPLVPTNNYIMYPLKDFIDAIKYLERATPRSAVILSETTAGNYIPVISGNTVYVGQANTVKSEEKESMVHLFFDGSMDAAAAQIFLKQNSIHYIYFGPQEIADGNIVNLASVYPFLREIYKNGYVRVYTW
jgi:hypothetical protein